MSSNPQDYVYNRVYRGKVQALILDWSGTTADAFVLAPSVSLWRSWCRRGGMCSFSRRNHL